LKLYALFALPALELQPLPRLGNVYPETPVSTSLDGVLEDDEADVAGGADGVGREGVFGEVQAVATTSGSATISQADRRIS